MQACARDMHVKISQEPSRTTLLQEKRPRPAGAPGSSTGVYTYCKDAFTADTLFGQSLMQYSWTSEHRTRKICIYIYIYKCIYTCICIYNCLSACTYLHVAPHLLISTNELNPHTSIKIYIYHYTEYKYKKG